MAGHLATLRDCNGPAIVYLHPASGIATHYRRLAPLLPPARTLLAFENIELSGPPPSIETFAAEYWAVLRDAVAGPIDFVGWSFGGTVALELATLAQEDGLAVSSVILLDAGAPQVMRSAPSLPLQDLAGLFGIQPDELPAEAAPTTPDAMLALVADLMRRTRGMDTIESADLQPFVEAYRWHHQVARRPWTFRGRDLAVHLVRARDERCWDGLPADLGWSAVLGTPPVAWWTPGSHHDLASEVHAPALADVLATILAGAGAE